MGGSPSLNPSKVLKENFREDKISGLRLSKILLFIPIFISRVPFFDYISIEIHTFYFDINKS